MECLTRQRRAVPLGGLIRLIAVSATLLTFALPARAQFTSRDGQIIARTLSFDEAIKPGLVEIGIVYAPDRPASADHAESVRAAIGDALVAGRITLKARLISVDQLHDADGIAAMYVTSDLGPHLDDAAAAARRLHVPTISKEMACVQSSRCMLAFSSQPAVEIVLNHDAATSAGVHFNQAFRMLVREQ
jgi:hypothetical protein